MIIIQSEKLENFFADLIDNLQVTSIEFFENLYDEYNFERTWDIPGKWMWKFNDPQDLEKLLNDYDLPKNDLIYL